MPCCQKKTCIYFASLLPRSIVTNLTASVCDMILFTKLESLLHQNGVGLVLVSDRIGIDCLSKKTTNCFFFAKRMVHGALFLFFQCFPFAMQYVNYVMTIKYRSLRNIYIIKIFYYLYFLCY